jgi:hypothetical protein
MVVGWRSIKPSRRTLLAASLGLIGAAVATIWVVRAAVYGPDADPGGRILRTLESAAQALPGDAHVLYRNDIEPRWDSCDGRPGTFGWNNVDVQIHFESTSASDSVVRNADENLARLGWRRTYETNQATFVQVVWTRPLENGSLATAQLSSTLPDQNSTTPRWDLFVAAPPVGPKVSGC